MTQTHFSERAAEFLEGLPETFTRREAYKEALDLGMSTCWFNNVIYKAVLSDVLERHARGQYRKKVTANMV